MMFYDCFVLRWNTDFDGLNLMSNFFSQLSSAFRSSCNCIHVLSLVYNKLSSAKRRMSDSVWLGMSLMYVKNNKGPSTVPCGTPDNTSSLSDLSLLALVVSCLRGRI